MMFGASWDVVPILAIKDGEGILYATSVGETYSIPNSVAEDEITVSILLPDNAENMDLVLYL